MRGGASAQWEKICVRTSGKRSFMVIAVCQTGYCIARCGKVLFDQCAFGLCTKIDKVPMRKRTYLLTNCDKVIARFSNKLCSRDHKHRVIEGSEGGMKRSVWAQFYPPSMVEALVDCV